MRSSPSSRPCSASERPAPDERWANGLDERAAAGFPRGGGRGPRGPKGRAAGSLRGSAPAAGWSPRVRWRPWRSSWSWRPRTSPIRAARAIPLRATSCERLDLDVLSKAGSELDANGEFSSRRPGSLGGFRPLRVGPAGYLDYGALRAFSRDAEKIAPGTENRKVDRSTQLKLSAKPEDVRGVSDEVISITRSLDGIVASSQVSETKGVSTATLELTLPTRNVDAALDRMTDLADVDSLNETTDDITKPFVSAQDQVKDAKAKRKELLEALGNATTDAEAEALTIRIADARREIARAEAAFDRIARKARLSDLSVTVTSNPNASDERTLGDWFDDAVDVLRGIAGVLLVSAAILIPLGLIAAICAFVASRLRKRSREKSLD